MIEFKVGDTISICASVDIYCSADYQIYRMWDINISKYSDPCNIVIGDPLHNCLPHSGVEIEFKFTKYDTILKSLGTRTTDSNGVASINHILTQEDANLYNTNGGITIKACFTATGPNYPSPTSGSYCKSISEFIIRGNYVGNACVDKGTIISLNDQTLIVYENPVYSDGTITQICILRSDTSEILPEAKVKIFRLRDSIWSVVEETGFKPLQNSAITTFATNIIVQNGDYLGLYIKTHSAEIRAGGAISPGYVKIHSGDVITPTNNSEWTTVPIYGTTISATLIPCAGITCPDKCFGTDLYHQICDPSQGGCIKGTLANANDPLCGAAVPTHRLDLTLKPWAWYTPESAANAIIPYLSDLNGKIINFFSGITDYQYISTEILPEGDHVILRINMKRLEGMASLGAPLAITQILFLVVIATLVLVAVGYFIRWAWYEIAGMGQSSGITNQQLTDAGEVLIKTMLDDCEKVTCADITNQDEKALCIKNCHDSIFDRWKEYQQDIYPDADHTPLDTGKSEVDTCYYTYMASGKTAQDYITYIDCLKIKRDVAIDEDKDNTLKTYDPNAQAGAKEVPGLGLAGMLLVGAAALGILYFATRRGR